jgi:hypothetical protein
MASRRPCRSNYQAVLRITILFGFHGLMMIDHQNRRNHNRGQLAEEIAHNSDELLSTNAYFGAKTPFLRILYSSPDNLLQNLGKRMRF